MRVLIVGAGIVGLSTAYALRKQGMDVIVVERGTIPFAHASSCDHHRLIRPFYGNAEGYCARMAAASAAWSDMWQDLPRDEDDYYAKTGIISVCRSADDYTDQSRVVMEKLNIPFERIDAAAELDRRFPFLEIDPIEYLLLAEGGALMANRILADLADWLRANGVDIRELTPITDLNEAVGSATTAMGEVIEADQVLLAAGVETSQLIPDLKPMLLPTRSLILYAEPPKDLAPAWREAPCWNDLGGGSDLWGMCPINGLPAKLGNGDLGSAEAKDDRRTFSAEEAKAMLDSYRGYFKGADRFIPKWGQANYWTQAPKSKFYLEQRGKLLIVSALSLIHI